MSRPLARDERLDWLRLARTPRIGPIAFARLIARYGDAAAALEVLARDGRGSIAPDRASAAAEIAAAEAFGARVIASCEPAYPALLARLSAPPPVLFVQGDIRLAQRPAVAIVGAREASAAGLALAETFARDLGAQGYVVVSGLARGIDARAHAASLSTGTIAVLPGGIDQPYPPQNLSLHAEVARIGLAVSDAPFGHVARAKDFPRRNPIIAGLAAGVVVIEAAEGSGSLITARAALDLGREAMAVPGSPLDPRSRGGNRLIKEGAALVETVEDVMAALGAAPRGLPAASTWTSAEDDPAPPGLAAALLRLLSPTPMHLNDIARAANATAAAVSAALLELELTGEALSTPAGYARRAPTSSSD